MSFESRLVLILEDITGKLPRAIQTLLSKKSVWRRRFGKEATPEELEPKAEQLVRYSAQWDPTPNQKYLQYIVQQLALGTLRLPEDGPGLQEALGVFDKKRANWTGENDIFKYKNWRELQQATTEYSGNNEVLAPALDYMKTWKDLSRSSSETIVDKKILTKTGTVHYKVIKITGWAGATLYGLGTQWCTSATPYSKIQVPLNKVYDTVLQRAEIWEQTKVEVAKAGVDIPMWPKGTPESRLAFIAKMNGLEDPQTWFDGPEVALQPRPKKGTRELIVPNTYFWSAVRTCSSYLDSGPLFVITKNGDRYIQMSSDGDIMNVNDSSLDTPGGALTLLLVDFLNVLMTLESEMKRRGLIKKISNKAKIGAEHNGWQIVEVGGRFKVVPKSQRAAGGV